MTDAVQEERDVPVDVRTALAHAAERLGVMAHRLHWLAIADSTNDVALRCAARGAATGTTIVAEAQTRGRGRHGRSWFSPPGAGLYVSVILRPAVKDALAGERAPAGLITMAAGVAVAEAVRAVTGLPAEIKWPNDVLVGGRKLAGILAEAVSDSDALQFVVVGIGLNLAPAAYPLELQQRATSIEAETSRPADRALVLVELLAALNARYLQLSGGSFDVILSDWRRLAPSIRSAVVEWDGSTGVTRGWVEDIDVDGALLVREGGSVRRVVSGEVRVIGMRRPGTDAARD